MVYDLYSGSGTIACFVAGSVSKVIGLEYIPEAVEDARANAQLNDIDNASFFAGDIKDLLKDEFVNQHGKPQVSIQLKDLWPLAMQEWIMSCFLGTTR